MGHHVDCWQSGEVQSKQQEEQQEEQQRHQVGDRLQRVDTLGKHALHVSLPEAETDEAETE